jgi:hypothetical protein
LCGVALTDGGKLAQLRIRVVTLGDLKQHRATPFYDHPPSSMPVLDFGAWSGRAKSTATIICVAAKKLTKN